MAKESMQFAYNCDTGEDIHISHYSVIVGKNEKLYCYCCNEPIVAKSLKSTKQISHFSHTASSSNEREKFQTYMETRIHKLSKQIISEQNNFRFKIDENIIKKEIKKFIPQSVIDNNKHLLSFNIDCSINETEKKRDNIIPDIILNDLNGNEFFIEIKVTHRVYEDKRNKIINQNASCIEIDLSAINRDLHKDELAIILQDLSLHSTINISESIYNKKIPPIINLIKKELGQLNEKLIEQKESYIKCALSKEENGELVNPNQKKEAFCLDCGGKLKAKNFKNYSHVDEKSSNCLLFSEKDNAEEKYFLYIIYMKIQHHYLNQGFILVGGNKYNIENIKFEDFAGHMKLKFKLKNIQFNFEIRTLKYPCPNADLYITINDVQKFIKNNFNIEKQTIFITKKASKLFKNEIEEQRRYISSDRNLSIYTPFVEKLKQLKINASTDECIFCHNNRYHDQRCHFMHSDETTKGILVDKLKHSHKLVKMCEAFINQEFNISEIIGNNFDFTIKIKDEKIRSVYLKNLEKYEVTTYKININYEYLTFTLRFKNGESKKIIISNDYSASFFADEQPNFVIDTLGYTLKECLSQEFITDNLTILKS